MPPLEGGSHSVLVKDYSGKTVCVEVGANESTEDLKRKISLKIGVSMEDMQHMQLVHDGKQIASTPLDPEVEARNPKHILEATQLLIDDRKAADIDWELLVSANSALDGQRWVQSLQYTWQKRRSTAGKCGYCGKPQAAKRCTGCTSRVPFTWANTSYCAEACQRAHWPAHRPACQLLKDWNSCDLDTAPPSPRVVQQFAERVLLSLDVCEASTCRAVGSRAAPALAPSASFLLNGSREYPNLKSARGKPAVTRCLVFEGTASLADLRDPITRALRVHQALAVALAFRVEVDTRSEEGDGTSESSEQGKEEPKEQGGEAGQKEEAPSMRGGAPGGELAGESSQAAAEAGSEGEALSDAAAADAAARAKAKGKAKVEEGVEQAYKAALASSSRSDAERGPRTKDVLVLQVASQSTGLFTWAMDVLRGPDGEYSGLGDRDEVPMDVATALVGECPLLHLFEPKEEPEPASEPAQECPVDI